MDKQAAESPASATQAEEIPEQEPVEPAFLSVRQAAALLGLSVRAVYSYIQEGRLSGEHRGKGIVLSAQAVATFVRRAPGRSRTTTPPWRQAPEQNRQYLTTITLLTRPEQGEQLACLLDKMRKENAHCLPGTAARYILCNQDDPQEITLVLVWRASIMPPAEERAAALLALRTDLAQVFNWETAVVKEGPALLHA